MTTHASSGHSRSIVVYERQPFWEPEFRRQFLSEDVAVRACRTISDLEQLTSTPTVSLVVANLSDMPAELLRWLSRRLASGRLPPVIVITGAATSSLQWHAREVGAIAVVNEQIGGYQLARLCRKQWSGTTPSTTRETT